MKVNLNMKIDGAILAEFSALAKKNDSDTSKELRKLMKEYVAKHTQQSKH